MSSMTAAPTGATAAASAWAAGSSPWAAGAWGRVPALRGVDLDVPAGSTTALVAPAPARPLTHGATLPQRPR